MSFLYIEKIERYSQTHTRIIFFDSSGKIELIILYLNIINVELFAMEEFKKQVDEFMSSYHRQLTLESESLSSSDRYKLHNYCRSMNLCSESIVFEGGKRVVLNKDKPLPEKTYHIVGIRQFAMMSEVPLKIPYIHKQTHMSESEIDKLRLQLRKLEQVSPGCSQLFEYYLRDLRSMNVKQERDRCTHEAAKIIKEHPQVTEFMNNQELLKGFKPNVTKQQKKEIYKDSNVGKHYVSFDIKQGCVSITKMHCPDLFPTTWDDFISKITKSEFVRRLKRNRCVIFSIAEVFEKIKKFYAYELDRLETHMDMGNAAYKNGDEIMFELDDLDEETMTQVMEKLSEYDRKFFKTEFFTLNRIKESRCYVRENVNGTKTYKGANEKQLLKAVFKNK